MEKGKANHNFLPAQYQAANELPINHNYLRQQFAEHAEILEGIERLVREGDFTLGKRVDKLEQKFAKLTKTQHAIGVGSGTDALRLSLQALGIKQGDEVITTPYTFFATVGAIAAAGAAPVFVDIREDYNINPDLIEKAITPRTKAILPVHWSGLICDMKKIREISDKHGLYVVEDACHAIKAHRDGRFAGSFGVSGCFSFHPLKNLNVWGDGGMIVTNNSELHDKLVLLRNHGLRNRDECEIWGYNSRLDTLQAIVADVMLGKLDHITNSRISNAQYYDQELSSIPQITIPKRDASKQVYHIYVIRAQQRDGLKNFLLANGIDAKVHYPIPMHLQPAAKSLGYKAGDFPMAEAVCDSVLSLPVHEFITRAQQNKVVKTIRRFYK